MKDGNRGAGRGVAESAIETGERERFADGEFEVCGVVDGEV